MKTQQQNFIEKATKLINNIFKADSIRFTEAVSRNDRMWIEIDYNHCIGLTELEDLAKAFNDFCPVVTGIENGAIRVIIWAKK